MWKECHDKFQYADPKDIEVYEQREIISEFLMRRGYDSFFDCGRRLIHPTVAIQKNGTEFMFASTLNIH